MTRDEKLRMLLHPERYTDEQLDEMLNETDIPVPDIDAEWKHFESFELRTESLESLELRTESLEFPTGLQTGSEQASDPSADSRAVANSTLSTLNSPLPSRAVANSKLSTLNSKLPSTAVANSKLYTLNSKLLKFAAAFIGVLMLSGIALVAVQFAKHDSDEECVVYVYGKKTTDQEAVMAEMKRSIGEIAEDNPQDNIEQQLNDLFSH